MMGVGTTQTLLYQLSNWCPLWVYQWLQHFFWDCFPFGRFTVPCLLAACSCASDNGRQYRKMYSNTSVTLCPVLLEVSKYGSLGSLLRSILSLISRANFFPSWTVTSLWSSPNASSFIPTTILRQSSLATSSKGMNRALKNIHKWSINTCITCTRHYIIFL